MQVLHTTSIKGMAIAGKRRVAVGNKSEIRPTTLDMTAITGVEMRCSHEVYFSRERSIKNGKGKDTAVIIESMKVANLHGYINHDIGFKPGVNILIGINGSGKTSVLNALAWTLKPNDVQGTTLAASKLATLKFDAVKISCKMSKTKSLEVIAKRTDEFVTIGVSGIKTELKFPAIQTPESPFVFTRRAPRTEELSEAILHHLDMQRNNPVLEALSNLQGPLYLPLDRRWMQPWDTDSRLRTISQGGQIPIYEVLRLAERANNQEQADVKQENETLRQRIIASSFEDSSQTFAKHRTAVPTPKQVHESRNRIVKTLTKLGIPNADDFTSSYFIRLEKTAKTLGGQKWSSKIPFKSPNFETWIEWLTDQSHSAYRIETLLKLIEEYETKTQKLTKLTTSFLTLLNSFLKDSEKSLYFDSKGDLVVTRGDDTTFSAAHLSSGELQLLTLFSFLHFRFDPNQQFAIIIDEPELSLHIDWQGRYINSIMKANPDAQFILATHSPEITAGFDDCCIDLTPKVQN